MSLTTTRIPSTERRRQILAVATELFAKQGFKGTTTRQVADKAQANEAILFRHFPHKEDLYWAVIEDKSHAAPGKEWLRNQLASSAPDHEIFAGIAAGLIERNTADTTLTRLLLYTALEEHELSARFFQTFVADYYDVLANYIRRRIAEGSFRAVDPLLAARGFFGMIVYHLLVQELFQGQRYQKFDVNRVAETVTEMWLEGMKVK